MPLSRLSPAIQSAAPAQARRRGRRWLGLALCAVVGLGIAWGIATLTADRTPIVVGLLHSQTGPFAGIERATLEAEVLAIDELNRQGGLMGRPVRYVTSDGATDASAFAREADRLIRVERVCVLFGGSTTEIRKEIVPVVEAANHLLVYPHPYEGLEQSSNVVYTGPLPNQQMATAVHWCIAKRSAKTFFLVGDRTDAARCASALAADQLVGLGAEQIGNVHLAAADDVAMAVQEIAERKPDVILSTLTGAPWISLLRALRAASIGLPQTTVIHWSIYPETLDTLPLESMHDTFVVTTSIEHGDTDLKAAGNGALSSASTGNLLMQEIGSPLSMRNCPSIALWAQAVREAGTADAGRVRMAMMRQGLTSRDGIITIDPVTLHTWLTASIARVTASGGLEPEWTLKQALRPVPFPIGRSREAWEQLVADTVRSQQGFATPALTPPEQIPEAGSRQP